MTLLVLSSLFTFVIGFIVMGPLRVYLTERQNQRNLYRWMDDANRRAIERQRGLISMNVEPPKCVEELHTLDDIEAEMNRSIERFRGGCDIFPTHPIEPEAADAEIPLPKALVGDGRSYGQPRGAPKPVPGEVMIPGEMISYSARKALATWEAMKPAHRPVMEKMSQPARDIPKERRELAGEALTLSVLSGIGAGDCLRMLNDGWHRATARWENPAAPIDYDG